MHEKSDMWMFDLASIVLIGLTMYFDGFEAIFWFFEFLGRELLFFYYYYLNFCFIIYV